MLTLKLTFPTLSLAHKAFRQISTAYRTGNSLLLLVLLLSGSALFIFSEQIFYQTDKIWLYGQITFWLWMTVFFSSLIEKIAFDQIPVRTSSNINLSKINNFYKDRLWLIKKLDSLKNPQDYRQVSKDSIRPGNLIILENGDEVPFDGKIIKGMCYVNETDISGSLEHKIKTPTKDPVLIAGSILECSNQIIMKVSFTNNKSFFTKAYRLLKRINRQAMPSEMALQRLALGLSLLFLAVIFVIWVIADYSGLKIPVIYLISLIVILLPTTVSGLQKAIIYNGWKQLAKYQITVHDQVAFDNAKDIDIILLDKTGTLTIGKRKMTQFQPVLAATKISDKDYIRYLYLSSFEDQTQEGRSISEFALAKDKLLNKKINPKLYKSLAFSAGNPISGCNYGQTEIRKGSLKAIAKYLGKTVKTLPQEVRDIAGTIAKNHGTPLLLAYNKQIIGVITLQDKFRKGIIGQIQKIQETGIITLMVTGDNILTSAHIANKLGISGYYADSTPEKKLALIRSFQKSGFVVAMCGDGVNDALALAQSDIGYTFEEKGKELHSILTGNIVAGRHDLSGLLDLKNECRKITIKRSALTVFSLTSDLANYFVIVPSLFSTAFPALSRLNVLQFNSLESVILASVIFNAIVIPCLAPIVFYDGNFVINKKFAWRTVLLYGISGIISPLFLIKLIELIILDLGLV